MPAHTSLNRSKKEKSLLSVGEVSQKLGVSISTLRRWDALGKLTSLRTPGNQRRYKYSQVIAFLGEDEDKGYIAERTQDKQGHKDTGLTGNRQEYTGNSPVSSRQSAASAASRSSRVLSSDPHQFLYAIIAAIVTVQLLHLAILKIPHVQASMNAATSVFLGAQPPDSLQALKDRVSSLQDPVLSDKQARRTPQEKIPVLSSDHPIPSRVLLSAFARAFFKSALYTGTHYYQSFAQKSNFVSTQGTYLLATTATDAAQNLSHDMASQMLFARSNLFPETRSEAEILREAELAEAEPKDPNQVSYLAQENVTLPSTVLGIADQENQDFTYGSILVDPYQSQVMVNFKTPAPPALSEVEGLTQVPISIIITPSYLTQTALTEITTQGFTVVLSETSPEPQTLYWLALW